MNVKEFPDWNLLFVSLAVCFFFFRTHDRIGIIIKVRENSGNRAFSQIPHNSAEEERRETSKDWSRMLVMPERHGKVTGGKQEHYRNVSSATCSSEVEKRVQSRSQATWPTQRLPSEVLRNFYSFLSWEAALGDCKQRCGAVSFLTQARCSPVGSTMEFPVTVSCPAHGWQWLLI